jgi:tetratricopeptide (TPR) repeat protein
MKRVLLLSAVLALVPVVAFAQTGTVAGAYVPPHIKLANTNLLNVGTGTVVVKVFVRADGTFAVQGITQSTNHDLNPSALDIARHSTYTPATKGGVPVVSFYELRLNFTGNGLSRYEAIIGTGAYASAKSNLQTYLLKHPADVRARFDLGLAESFMGDDAGAVEAFEKAGPVPEQFKAVASKSYAAQAVTLIKAEKYDDALPLAKKAVLLSPSYQTLDNLGLVELKTGDTASALTDLDKARTLAALEKAPLDRRADIASNLAAVYARKGDLPEAKAYAAEAVQLDPSAVVGYAAVRGVYTDQAEVAMKAGHYTDAAALYEQAATVSPSDKATLYANAAFSYLKMKTRAASELAKADADKALAIDPHHAGANFAAGIALADQGKRREALAYLSIADVAAKNGTDSVLTQNIEKYIADLNGSKKKRN